MASLFHLIQSENIKLYFRKRTYFFMGVVVLAAFLQVLIVQTTFDDVPANWKEQLARQNKEYTEFMQKTKETGAVTIDLGRDNRNINEYRIENDITPLDPKTFWVGIKNGSYLSIIVASIAVIVVADMVAGEFHAGTIKLLLIRPASRTKILLAKFIAVLLFALLLMALVFLSAALFSALFFGLSNPIQPYLYETVSGSIVSTSLIGNALSSYGYALVGLVMLVSLGFMLATITRSVVAAVAGVFAVKIMGELINMNFSEYGWVQYLFTANTDLTQYIEGAPIVEGMTMGFSIFVLFIYFAVFTLSAFIVFNKRDVSTL